MTQIEKLCPLACTESVGLICPCPTSTHTISTPKERRHALSLQWLKVSHHTVAPKSLGSLKSGRLKKTWGHADGVPFFLSNVIEDQTPWISPTAHLALLVCVSVFPDKPKQTDGSVGTHSPLPLLGLRQLLPVPVTLRVHLWPGFGLCFLRQ